MKVDCYMSELCGSYHQLRQNIEAALAELGAAAEVVYHTIYYDDAIKLGVKGSPFIRINGRDMVEGGSPGIL